MGQGRNNKEMKDFLSKLMDTMKVVLRGKFIALNVYIEKCGKSHTSNLTAHPKALKQ